MPRRGISTAVIAVIVVIVVAAAAGGIYLATRSTSSTTAAPPTTTTSSSQVQVSSTTTSTSTSAFSKSTGNNSAVLAQEDLFVQAFNDRDVSSISNFFTSSSVENWVGNTEGLGGVYNGAGQIEILYAASIGHTQTFKLTPSNLTMVTTAPNLVNVSATFSMLGYSPALGNITAKALVEQQWMNQNGGWIIQEDHWNYLVFYASNPISSTVFPQWGLQIAGQNPNLAQEHKFEWNLAPYLAAALYATIVAVAIAAVMISRRKSRVKT